MSRCYCSGMRITYRFLFQVLFSFVAVSTAAAATYTFTTLQYPGALGTYPLSINKSGTIAGYFYDSGVGGHGFVYSGGAYTQIDAGGTCGSTFVTGINDAGVIAGYCFPSEGGTRSFVDNKGTFTYFTLPNILDSYTEAINNKTLSVGWLFTNANTVASFYAIDGKPVKAFTAPGSVATAAYGINNTGVVVGNGIPANGGTQEGFVLQNGVFTFSRYPNSYTTFFNGLNDLLQVAGDQAMVARGPVSAFLFQNGVFTDLQPPNAVGSVASGINNSGVVVGYYTTGSNNIEINAAGFVATP